MKRRLAACLTIAAFGLGASPLSAHAGQPPKARTDSAEGSPTASASTAWLKLSHPIASDVVTSSTSGPVPASGVTGVRFEQPGLVGEVFASPTSTLAANLIDAAARARHTYGVPLAVTAVEIKTDPNNPGQARTVLEQLDAKKRLDAPPMSRTKLAAIQRTSAAGAPTTTRGDAVRTRTPTAAAAPALSPFWTPHTASSSTQNRLDASGRPSAAAGVLLTQTYNWFTGPSPYNRTVDKGSHDPERFDQDWGIELDYNLWNDSIPAGRLDKHPNCPWGTDDNFWAARGTATGEIRSWHVALMADTTSSAEHWGAYFDGNDFTDPCNRLGVSIGIGYPKNLNDGVDLKFYQNQLTLVVTMLTDKGTQTRSVQSANFQAVHNDCYVLIPPATKVATKPTSDCMGLSGSTGSSPYAFQGGDPYKTWAGKSLGFTAPGVLYWESGYFGARNGYPFD